MSSLKTNTSDRRSSRALHSRTVAKSPTATHAENKVNIGKDIETVDNEPKVHVELAEVTKETKLELKNLNDKEQLKQIENIPDNTQLPVLAYETEDLKNHSVKRRMDKKEYKKKSIKSGITDRDWLSSKEHRDKWTALDAKRGMCNDCKKMFSSRQVHINAQYIVSSFTRVRWGKGP